MLPKLAIPRSAWSSSAPFIYLQQTSAVAESDVRKLIHDPVELFTRMVQPVLWLVVFGQVFARTRAIPTGGLPYLDFMAPGILAQSVVFGAMFYGISLIWERDLGVVHKFLVSPAPRTALVLGRAVSSAIRGCLPNPGPVRCRAPARSSSAAGMAHDGRSAGCGEPWCSDFLDFFTHCGLHRQVSRAIHGDWTSSYYAVVFRKQCDLSAEHDASLAACSILCESSDLPGRCTEILNGPGRPYRVRIGLRFIRADTDFRPSHRNRGEAVSEHYPLSRNSRQQKAAFEFA